METEWIYVAEYMEWQLISLSTGTVIDFRPEVCP